MRRSLRRALAIGAAAAERRAFGENLAVVLVVAARPLGIAVGRSGSLRGCSCQALRPSRARRSNFGRSSRPSRGGRTSAARGTGVALRPILARPRKTRTLVAAAILARLVVAGLSKRGLSKLRAPSRGGRELRPAWSGDEASRFCHGFESPRSPGSLLRYPGSRSPKSLRGPRSGAPRENFLSPPNFRSGRSPRGRSPSRGGRALIGAIAARAVAALAEALAARRIGSLFATAFARAYMAACR